MGKKPRGRVLVINNKIFYGPLEEDQLGRKRVTLQTREGTEQDQRQIKEVFEQLNFLVDVFQDKKGDVRKNSFHFLRCVFLKIQHIYTLMIFMYVRIHAQPRVLD